MGALAAAGIGGIMGAIDQNQQNQANIGLQNAAENWETQMSDTAHQREVSDLEAAGLNPILSAGGLSGASTPSAPPVSVTAPGAAAVSGAESSMSSAMDVMKGLKDLDSTDADIDQKRAQTKLVEAQTANTDRSTGQKSLESDVTSDADAMYKQVRARFIDWYNRSGLYDTGALRPTSRYGGSGSFVPDSPAPAPGD